MAKNYAFTERLDGAEDGSNLEPFCRDLLLATLEEWSDVLKHDEELIHMLQSFQKVSVDAPENIGFEHDVCLNSANSIGIDETASSDWEPSP